MDMNRPLWQILFTLSFAAFVAAAAGVGWVLNDAGKGSALLPPLYALQGLAALATALGALLERSWALGAAIASGALLATSIVVGALAVGRPAPLEASSGLLVAVLLTTGIGLMLRTARDRAGDPGSRRADGPDREGGGGAARLRATSARGCRGRRRG